MSGFLSLRARFVGSIIVSVMLVFIVLLPATAGVYYFSGGSNPYYSTSGAGSTYYTTRSNSTIYQSSNYSTYYSTKYNSTSQRNYYRIITPQEPSAQVPEPHPPVSTNPPSSSPAPGGNLTSAEQKMVNLVNQERSKAGLQQLRVDMSLVELARNKSQDMIDRNYFGHNSPTYGSPFDMMRQAGVKYSTAAENLAGAASVESAHANLMASSGHRANILNPRFNYLGAGIASGGPYGNMFTQLFVGR